MNLHFTGLVFLILPVSALTTFADPKPIPDHQIIPLPGKQVSLQFKGIEKARWHSSSEYPRPFFFPFNGPSGSSLTRMGHPGAPNHDHHRSIWFAHHVVDGIDFWGDQTDARIREKSWLAYEDGNNEAIMACLLGWFDGNGKELMEQEMVAALMSFPEGEHALEIQITLRPGKDRNSVQLGKTNFGILAVRVAKTLSEFFGGGTLTSSEAATSEKDIFGKPARWMDYSGPVIIGRGESRKDGNGRHHLLRPPEQSTLSIALARSGGRLDGRITLHERGVCHP